MTYASISSRLKKEELFSLAALADAYYKPYRTTKRRSDGTIKTRLIEPPANGSYLKNVQRRIKTKILNPAISSLPENIKGARKGCSLKENVRAHAGSNAVMKFDIENFFPSITTKRVYKIFRYKLGFTEEAANLLALITTYRGHLPQGAPTSPGLAILATSKMCRKLAEACQKFNLKSTSWVDDVIISGKRKNLEQNQKQIGKIVADMPYALNKKKNTGVIVYGSNKTVTITGVTLQPNGSLRLPELKRNLRKRIKKAKQYSPSLDGKLRYLEQIEPKYGKRLRLVYLEKVKTQP